MYIFIIISCLKSEFFLFPFNLLHLNMQKTLFLKLPKFGCFVVFVNICNFINFHSLTLVFFFHANSYPV